MDLPQFSASLLAIACRSALASLVVAGSVLSPRVYTSFRAAATRLAVLHAVRAVAAARLRRLLPRRIDVDWLPRIQFSRRSPGSRRSRHALPVPSSTRRIGRLRHAFGGRNPCRRNPSRSARRIHERGATGSASASQATRCWGFASIDPSHTFGSFALVARCLARGSAG